MVEAGWWEVRGGNDVMMWWVVRGDIEGDGRVVNSTAAEGRSSK